MAAWRRSAMPSFLGAAPPMRPAAPQCGLRPASRPRSLAIAVPTAVRRAVRRAGAARDRHRLPDDHAGARPDRLGPRLSLDHVTNGDNGLRCARGRRRSASTSTGGRFYYFTLIVFARRAVLHWRALRARPSAPRCEARATSRAACALGYNVWPIRWLAFLFSGFWARSPASSTSTTPSSSARRRWR